MTFSPGAPGIPHTCKVNNALFGSTAGKVEDHHLKRFKCRKVSGQALAVVLPQSSLPEFVLRLEHLLQVLDVG